MGRYPLGEWPGDDEYRPGLVVATEDVREPGSAPSVLGLSMLPVVLAGGVTLPIMVISVATIMVMVVAMTQEPGAAAVPVEDAEARFAALGLHGHWGAAGVGLLAHRDELLKLSPVQPHPFAPGADIDRDAKALDFFHPFVAHGTLHRILSFD
jgi:hypothetical protein